MPAQVELHAALAWLAPSTGPTGRRAQLQPRPARGSASSRAWPASCACRSCCAGCSHWREGDWDEAEDALPPRARAGRAGRLVRGRLLGAVRPGHRAAPTAGDFAAPAPRSARRSTSASAPASSPSRSRRSPARAEVLALAGKDEQAAEAAKEATELADAAALPGRPRGRASGGGLRRPPTAEQLAEAREAWLEIGRPLDAARCAPAGRPPAARERSRCGSTPPWRTPPPSSSGWACRSCRSGPESCSRSSPQSTVHRPQTAEPRTVDCGLWTKPDPP